MSLSDEQIAARKGKFTASRAACLMTADTAEILNLYYELTDDPRFVPVDLSDVWPVQLGATTEALNLRWFAKDHGEVTRQGQVVCRPAPFAWAACTLDGWSERYLCPIEAKHTGGRENLSIVIDRYQPQMHWQMIVTGANQCALSIIMGANEPIVEFIPYDEDYGSELENRAFAFMACVHTRTPPVELKPAPPPVIPEKTYDMTESNIWAISAAAWLANKAAKQTCIDAEKELKGLVPQDAKKCLGHGVSVIRDRANRLSLRETL